jgi:hypothetical protein
VETLGAQGRVVRDATRKLTRTTLQRTALVGLTVASAAAAATLAAAGRIGAEAQVKASGDCIELVGGKLVVRNIVVGHFHFSC